MRRKSAGEVATALVVAIALGSLIAGYVLPKINPFKFFHSSSAANHKASFTLQKETSKPVLLQDSQGKAVAVGREVELTYSTGMEETVPKKTLGQKIGDFFAGLTTAGVGFVIISLLFFGGAPLIFVWRWGLKFKQALTTTVAGIRDLDKDTYEKVTPKLAAAQDKKDKIVIDKIKAKLH